MSARAELRTLAMAVKIEAEHAEGWYTVADFLSDYPDAVEVAHFMAACSPERILSLLDDLAKAEAVNDAHSLGWYYEDTDGTWREGDDGAFKCLDEDLVVVIAGLGVARTAKGETT